MEHPEKQKKALGVIMRNRQVKGKPVTISQLGEILEYVKEDSFWRGTNMQTFTGLGGKTDKGVWRVEHIWHQSQKPDLFGKKDDWKHKPGYQPPPKGGLKSI